MISQQAKERIAKEAEKFAECNSPYPTAFEWNEKGYIAGAEAEATRAAGLVDAIKEIKNAIPDDDNFDAGQVFFVIDDIITTTISKYNNTK